MNGQFQVLPDSTADIKAGASSRLRYAEWGRLLVALACSCLLHLLIIAFLDSLAPVRHSGLAAAGGGRLFAFSAMLFSARDAGHMLPDRSGQSAPLKEAPVPFVAADETVQNVNPVPAEPNGADEVFGLLLPGGPYYLASQLTSRPQALAEVEPPAPEILAKGAFGNIVMNLWISASGEVLRISVDSSELPEPVASATVEAFLKLRFKPGELDGQKVGTVMKIEAAYDNGPLPGR